MFNGENCMNKEKEVIIDLSKDFRKMLRNADEFLKNL
jgi:hypothetical protein